MLEARFYEKLKYTTEMKHQQIQKKNSACTKCDLTFDFDM